MDRPLDTFLGDMMADDTLPISASCMATENDLPMFNRKYFDLQMVGFSQPKKIHGLVLQSMCWEEWHEKVFSYQMVGKLIVWNTDLINELL